MTNALCTLADLEATGAKEVILTKDAQRISVVVASFQGHVYAYVNSCPHARLPLNWRDDQFFDPSGQYLFCANHAASFDVATGQCVRGPGKGKVLNPFPIRVADGVIYTQSET
jgi:nitrite reductase/ring-hydroxylating ferredoxin subunit